MSTEKLKILGRRAVPLLFMAFSAFSGSLISLTSNRNMVCKVDIGLVDPHPPPLANQNPTSMMPVCSLQLTDHSHMQFTLGGSLSHRNLDNLQIAITAKNNETVVFDWSRFICQIKSHLLRCTKLGSCAYYTAGNSTMFSAHAFLNSHVQCIY